MHRKRIYDKKPSCFFCQKDYLKLARQYEQVHTQMRTKLNWLWNSPWNPKKENNNLLSCGKWGNFNHNMQVLENKEGELKVHKRPTGTVTPPPQHYLPCTSCNGFFWNTSFADMQYRVCTMKKGKSPELDKSSMAWRFCWLCASQGNSMQQATGREHSSNYGTGRYNRTGEYRPYRFVRTQPNGRESR